MDTKQFLGLMEAYAEVYAPQQIDEISQKTATRAYATSYTGEFEGADSERDVKRTDNLRKQIKRKFGNKAAQHADRAGHAMTFGRKGAGGMPPKPTKEDFDIFDVVLEFLQVEGFAETLEEAEWMMANMIDEEAIDIILGEGVTIRDYKRKREMYKKSESGGKSSRVGLGPSGSEARVERGLEDTGSYKANERGIGGVTKNPKKLRKQKAIGELGESQEARNNPEKYEREQSKKSAPVRGEKTPMPPRGDKRREDFEKWYAKQMGR